MILTMCMMRLSRQHGVAVHAATWRIYAFLCNASVHQCGFRNARDVLYGTRDEVVESEGCRCHACGTAFAGATCALIVWALAKVAAPAAIHAVGAVLIWMCVNKRLHTLLCDACGGVLVHPEDGPLVSNARLSRWTRTSTLPAQLLIDEVSCLWLRVDCSLEPAAALFPVGHGACHIEAL